MLFGLQLFFIVQIEKSNSLALEISGKNNPPMKVICGGQTGVVARRWSKLKEKRHKIKRYRRTNFTTTSNNQFSSTINYCIDLLYCIIIYSFFSL